ncbi:hypothetical protein ACRAWD_07820 [Caulobacter segnis]
MAIFHQRYSTNTFPVASGPALPDARPQRRDQHDQRSNINWMKSRDQDGRPGLRRVRGRREAGDPAGRLPDSANLDNTFEVLVRAGRDAPMAKALLVPEASNPKMKDAHKALYSTATP